MGRTLNSFFMLCLERFRSGFLVLGVWRRKLARSLRERFPGASDAARFLDHLLKVPSLRMKLTFGSAAVATVILLVTYSTLSSSTRDVASKQAEEHAAELLSYFSGMMAEAVAANDRIQIHLLARALLNNGVHALAVVDGDGKIQYSPPRHWENWHPG